MPGRLLHRLFSWLAAVTEPVSGAESWSTAQGLRIHVRFRPRPPDLSPGAWVRHLVADGFCDRMLSPHTSRSAPFDADRLLRHSGSADPVTEIRETERVPDSADRDAIHQRWQELARDRAALEQRQILLLRDTILFDLGRRHRGSNRSPTHNY